MIQILKPHIGLPPVWDANPMNIPPPVGAWVLNEGSGNKAFDLSGNSNNGTINGATWAGGGLSFDGNDYIDLGASSLTIGSSITTGVTISMWLQTGDTSESSVFGHFKSNVGLNLQLKVNSDSGDGASVGSIFTLLDDDGTASTRLSGGVDSDTGITDGNWHHISAVLDLAGNNIYIYIDGVSQSVIYAQQNADTSHSNFSLNPYIGARNLNAAANEFFNGIIDEVMIFNFALTPAQNHYIYTNPYYAWDYALDLPVWMLVPEAVAAAGQAMGPIARWYMNQRINNS